MLRKEDFEQNMKTEDKIPRAQTENPAQSQRFGDFIVKYMQNVQNTIAYRFSQPAGKFPDSVKFTLADSFFSPQVPAAQSPQSR